MVLFLEGLHKFFLIKKKKMGFFANQPTVYSEEVNRRRLCGCGCWRSWQVTDTAFMTQLPMITLPLGKLEGVTLLMTGPPLISSTPLYLIFCFDLSLRARKTCMFYNIDIHSANICQCLWVVTRKNFEALRIPGKLAL